MYYSHTCAPLSLSLSLSLTHTHTHTPLSYEQAKLHPPAEAESSDIETLSDHWVVRDQFDFENVGVTKSIDGDTSFRYLTCADCDKGPIGIK